ncbi:DMT family transporter [Segatella albensis]|jgi:small multidrug resistance pump|uniref:DMT family transporter n=1 Tax=Segatella albensis TaxID=77768 RepID=UPI0004153D1B|nr:SMR family transporter [Segatella albensis]
MKEWLFLIGAIFLETFATSMLKYSEQFTKLLPTTAMVVGYMFSFYCLSHAQRTGTSDEIAEAAAFLLGEHAKFITGTDLLIDGGVIAAIRTGEYQLG